MQKLFLASLFKEVSQIFQYFANENLLGKTVTFIPTAALPDKLDFHVEYSKELLHTFFLLQEMNRSGAGDLIKKQINAGKLFIGESAGAILLAPDIEYVKDTDDPLVAPQLKTFEALNIIDFYPVPHYKDDLLKEIVSEKSDIKF